MVGILGRGLPRCRGDLSELTRLLLLLLNEPGGGIVRLRVILLIGIDVVWLRGGTARRRC